MMEGHEIATYGGGLQLEIGWSKDPEMADMVRVHIGDKKAMISYKDLYGFVLLNSAGDDLDKLAPVQQTLVRKFMKQHVVMAQKDIKRGQSLVVNCEIDVPIQVVEALRGDLNKARLVKPSSILSAG